MTLGLLRRAALAIVAAVAIALPSRVAGQAVETAAPGSIPTLTVTLITFGQGADLFERFGHNALWFHDASTLEDVAYHWGLFDFNEPNFVLRFLTGENRYSMGPVNPQALIDFERNRGRPVTLQQLNLTAEQATALRERVRRNAIGENRFYRYDYFADNCSTRLRDALDASVGGALKRAADAQPATLNSYRRESVRLTKDMPAVAAGIDIALGRPADVPLTMWQSFFIPMRLRDALRMLKVPGPAGDSVTLVASERVLPQLVPPPAVEVRASPRLVPRYLLGGLAFAALVVALRIMTLSRRSAAWGLALFGAAWSLLCGLLGVILLLAWFATRHQFWASNLSVLLLSPLSLPLVVLIPPALLKAKYTRPARMLAGAIALLGMLALLCSLVPLQENRAVVALFLPVHLALAWAIGLPRNTLHPPTGFATKRRV